jgi:DNA gyrase subunit A
MPDARRIEPIEIEEEMQRSFLDYAMSVIVARALPDVRDGLKPVHRRILWGANEEGVRPPNGRRKSAYIVGSVLGKYHPHGDTALYDAMVRLGQDFASRYPLIDGQGNFGSADGDEAAAMRYCVTGDTLVATPDGTLRMDRIHPDARPNSDTDIDLKVLDRLGNPVRASKLFHSGSHPTLRVRTTSGYEITGTHNHPLLCLVGVAGVPMLLWKLLAELQPGDHVVLARRAAANCAATAGDAGELPHAEWQRAVLAGAMVSEGWASHHRAGFNNLDKDYFELVVDAYDAVVGGRRYVSNRVIRSGSRIYELDVQQLAELRSSPLAEMIGLRSESKRVPGFVWTAPPAFKLAFLRSLFTGDGSSSLLPRKTIQVSYSTRSPRLAAEAQQLLLEFGVASRQSRNARGEIKVVITNRHSARRFAANIGFMGAKQAKLQRELAQVPLVSRALSHDHIPFVADYIREECGSSGDDAKWLRRHNIDRVERWERDGDEILRRITSEEVQRVVEPLVNAGYLYAKVESVTDTGVQPVYSLRVDSDDHAFITNGFISHNTEARLNPLAMELLRDIDKETVDFQPNYDNESQEPIVLPARFPNLLANGSEGIAVGMATKIPPHNLGEVIDATVAMIDNPELTSEDLLRWVKGPDFPTGAQVMGTSGIRDAYTTGRGSIRVRSKVRIEENNRGGQRLVVTELPYQVSGDRLLMRIRDLVREGRLTGIVDIANENSREGTRLVIECRRDAVPQVVLNQLYKHTQLQDSFGVITLALVDGVPRVLNLAEMLSHYIAHQVTVVVRRTRYELRKARERAHILEGLLIALDHLDEVINLIRNAESADVARAQLMERYSLSEVQATAILDMQLRRLAALERRKLQEEYAELQARIAELQAILDDPSKVRGIVKEELGEIKRRFADPRRTEIRPDEGELSIEDLIAAEPVVVTVTRTGYVKRVALGDYRAQGRGGRGVRGANLKEDDIVQFLALTNTHHWVLFFTNKGRVYRVKVHELPEAAKNARGTYVANVPGATFQPDEKIAAVLDLDDYDDGKFLVLGTKNGMVKKTALSEYDSPRVGLIAINLRGDDELIGVKLTSGEDDLLFVSRKGMAVRFSESHVRPMGRQTSGVTAMRLRREDQVLAMEVVRPNADLLVVTDAGYGKRTPLEQYARKGRGIQGVKTAELTEVRGFIAGAHVVQDEDDIFLITDAGQIIRTRVNEVRRAGRATQGVRIMRLARTSGRVAAVAPVVKDEE